MAVDWDKSVLVPLMDIFGEPVIYTPFDGAPFSISGVFDEAYEGIDLAGGMPINTVMPVLGVRIADFVVQPDQDDTLQIIRTGEKYVVKDVRPDSHGGAKLLLQWVRQ